MGPTAKSARLRLILVPGLHIRFWPFCVMWSFFDILSLLYHAHPMAPYPFDGTPCLFPASLLVRRRRTERKEKDIPRDRSLHPLTALSFHVPDSDKSRQDVTCKLLLISQSERLSFICKQTNKCIHFLHACV